MEENFRRMGISVIIAVFVGIIITYVSGFFRPLLPERTIDLLQWGSPFHYLHKLVTFPGLPYINWTMAAMDFLIWVILLFAIIFTA